MPDDTAQESSGRTRPDLTTELKVRARRRLIGAAALLLAVIVIVPAVLDPTPKPLPDAIPIDIPSEKSPFTPRLSLPPLPEPVAGSVAPAETAPAGPTKAEKDSAAPGKSPPATGDTQRPAKTTEAKSSAKRAAEPTATAPKPAEPKSDAKAAEAKRARDLLDGRAETAADKAGETKSQFVLQAAAPSSETAAKELADRIGVSGLKSYVEKFDAKDGVRYRVRVGPYGSRDEAERARARLRAIGVNSNLVAQ